MLVGGHVDLFFTVPALAAQFVESGKLRPLIGSGIKRIAEFPNLPTLREVGIDLSGAKPQLLTTELAAGTRLLVTLGCGEECPFLPGVEVEDWPLQDPKDQPISRVREIRGEVETRVTELVKRRGWGRASQG